MVMDSLRPYIETLLLSLSWSEALILPLDMLSEHGIRLYASVLSSLFEHV